MLGHLQGAYIHSIYNWPTLCVFCLVFDRTWVDLGAEKFTTQFPPTAVYSNSKHEPPNTWVPRFQQACKGIHWSYATKRYMMMAPNVPEVDENSWLGYDQNQHAINLGCFLLQPLANELVISDWDPADNMSKKHQWWRGAWHLFSHPKNDTLPETNSSSPLKMKGHPKTLKIGLNAPKGNYIVFQLHPFSGANLLLLSGRFCAFFHQHKKTSWKLLRRSLNLKFQDITALKLETQQKQSSPKKGNTTLSSNENHHHRRHRHRRHHHHHHHPVFISIITLIFSNNPSLGGNPLAESQHPDPATKSEEHACLLLTLCGWGIPQSITSIYTHAYRSSHFSPSLLG